MNVVAAVILVGAAPLALTASLPSFLKPCKKSDPKLTECVESLLKDGLPHFVKGIPNLGIPVLDPLRIEHLAIQDSDESSRPISLKLLFDDVNIKGFAGLIMNGVKIKLGDKPHYELKAFLSSIQVEGQYSVNGRVLLLPITGRGRANITAADMALAYTVDMKVVKGKDGRDYYQLHNATLDVRPRHVYIHLDNLFNGDKTLGDAMNQFLNENWREVLEEFGPAIRSTCMRIISLMFDNMANKIPMDLVFID